MLARQLIVAHTKKREEEETHVPAEYEGEDAATHERLPTVGWVNIRAAVPTPPFHVVLGKLLRTHGASQTNKTPKNKHLRLH